MKFANQEIEEANKAIQSTINKNEKVLITLSSKENPRIGQIKNVEKQLRVLKLMKSLINQQNNSFTKEQLIEAKDETMKLIENVSKFVPKFKVGTPQHTLAIRRIAAFKLALSLIEDKL